VKNAAVYCRISSDPEGREVGVQRQEADCLALADRLGWTVAQVYVENDVSASTRSSKPRPKYADMIRRTKDGEYDAVIAYSMSRLTRRPREVDDLIALAEKNGVDIRTCVSGDLNVDTADGRAVARTLAAWDAAEAERVSERVSRAKAQARTEGRYRGGPRPFGYEKDGVTVKGPEASALLQAARDVLDGRSLGAIAREMTAAGLTNTRGAAMTSMSVRRMLLRPRNAGLLESDGEVTGRAVWPAIIPEDLWRAVRAHLADPRRRNTPGPTRRWLGSGLYRCGVCQRPMLVTQSNKRPCYRCQDGCVSRYVPSVDGKVVGVVKALLSDPRIVRLLAESDVEDAGDELGQIEALRARLATFEADYAGGDITGRQLRESTDRISAEVDQLQRRLAAQARTRSLVEVLNGSPAERFDSLDLDRRRAIVDELVEVTINRAKHLGRPTGWRPGEPYADLASVEVIPRWSA
jgi:site-specific DNA recombinase